MMHTGIQTPYGAGDQASGLNLSYTLLPEQLKLQFNYTNYMIGKWHLGMKNAAYLPSARGFDKFNGYYLGCSDYWKHYGDLGDNEEIALDWHEGGRLLGLEPGVGDRGLYNTSGQYSTEMYADTASRWIQEHDTSVPFFMYLAFQGAHSANNKFVQAPEHLLEREDIRAISPNATCGQWELPSDAAAAVGGGQCTKEAMRKSVAATVIAIDNAVAKVEAALKKRPGMLERTLIVFSTDNGGPTDGTNDNMMNNFPLRSGKGEIFEGGVRGVGFVNGFGISEKRLGTRYNRLFHVSDWYRTLLDFASAASASSPGTSTNAPPSVVPTLKPNEREFLDGDGISLYRSLLLGDEGADVPVRNEIFIAAQASGSTLHAQGIRVGAMKLLKYPMLLYNKPAWYPPPGLEWNYTSTLTVKCGQPPDIDDTDLCVEDWCLFNLTNDPCEYVNLAASMPSVVASMQKRLVELSKTTVLPWTNFSEKNPNASNPLNFGPTTPIRPDPQTTQGPHEYQGIWMPWVSDEEERELYPSNYEGPGYPM
eukprot:g3623.t1